MSQVTEAGFTTEIPMTFRRRGGKAVIVLPDGSRAIERREALIATPWLNCWRAATAGIANYLTALTPQLRTWPSPKTSAHLL